MTGRGLSRRAALRRAALLLGALTAPSAFGACAGTSPRQTQAGTLVVAVDELPQQLDPHRLATPAERRLARLLFTSLVPPPWGSGLATGWERRAPGRWRFTLGGDELASAPAVQWSVQRLGELSARGLLPAPPATLPAGAEIVAPDTVDLLFTPASVVVPDMLAELYILPPRHYATMSLEVAAREPRGSGPYAVESWTAADRLVLRRTPARAADAPGVERVRWVAKPTAEARLALVLAKEADVACDIDLADVRRASAAGLAVLETEEAGNVHGLFDQRVKPLADRRVRQALNHAVNLEPWLRRYDEGRARPLAGVCDGDWENRALAPYGHDPSRARALLEAAGLATRDGQLLDGGEPFVVRILTTPALEATARYVARELERNGITSPVTSVAPAELGPAMRTGSPPFGLTVGQVEGLPTGVGELRRLDPRFRPDLAPGTLAPGPGFQAALDQLAELDSPEAVRARVAALQEEVLEDAPWLFLYRLPRYTAHRAGLAGLSIAPTGEVLLDRASLGS